LERIISKKSTAVGTGAMLLRLLVAIVSSKKLQRDGESSEYSAVTIFSHYVIMDKVDEALALGAQLFEVCASGERRQIERLRQDGAPVWYSEPETGWTVLHLAASLEDEALVKLLLENSAIWNAGKVA
jgi:Ankyrin repeat